MRPSSSTRVAYRYLQRLAGLLQPPPRVLEPVPAWARKRIAEHALALIPESSGGDSAALAQRFNQQVDTLAEGQSAEADFGGVMQDYIKVTKLPGGMFKVDSSAMSVPSIDRGFVDNMVNLFAGRGAKGDEDWAALRKEAQGYASTPKDHTGGVSMVLPVDLDGWKYLNGPTSIVSRVNDKRRNFNDRIDAAIAQARKVGVDKVVFLERKPNFVPPGVIVVPFGLQYDMEVARGAQLNTTWDPDVQVETFPVSQMASYKMDYLDKNDVAGALKARAYDRIRVELVVQSSRSQGFSAKWHDMSKTLQLVIEPFDVGFPQLVLKRFRDAVDQVEDTVEHESIHLAQSLLQALKGVYGAGTPSRHSRPQQVTWEPGAYMTDISVHHLSDNEFYTVLNDKIREFQRQMRGRTPSNADVHRFIDRDYEFFGLLKDSAPQRWRKAISEFTNAVM